MTATAKFDRYAKAKASIAADFGITDPTPHQQRLIDELALCDMLIENLKAGVIAGRPDVDFGLIERWTTLRRELSPPDDDGLAKAAWDMARLSDTELAQLEKLAIKATDTSLPPWRPMERRRRGRAEYLGVDLGRWLDQRADQFRSRPLTATEATHLRSALTAMCDPVLVRHLFAFDDLRPPSQPAAVIDQAPQAAITPPPRTAEIAKPVELLKIEPPTVKPYNPYGNQTRSDRDPFANRN